VRVLGSFAPLTLKQFMRVESTVPVVPFELTTDALSHRRKGLLTLVALLPDQVSETDALSFANFGLALAR
jgi:hypothetical protein